LRIISPRVDFVESRMMKHIVRHKWSQLYYIIYLYKQVEEERR